MKNNRGFTVIEIAIVLVVIGLIVGGVLTGTSLITAAESRAVMNKLQHYGAAYTAFRQQYNALPGDMVDATDNWAGTANGDGDRTVNINTESLRAWQHMSLARLVDGDYSGAAVGGNIFVADANIPSGPQNGTGFLIHNGFAGDATLLVLDYALPTGATLNNFNGAAISALDASSIDTRMDDGNAQTGEIRAVSGTGLAATACHNAGVYATTDNPTCQLALRLRN